MRGLSEARRRQMRNTLHYAKLGSRDDGADSTPTGRRHRAVQNSSRRMSNVMMYSLLLAVEELDGLGTQAYSERQPTHGKIEADGGACG